MPEDQTHRAQSPAAPSTVPATASGSDHHSTMTPPRSRALVSPQSSLGPKTPVLHASTQPPPPAAATTLSPSSTTAATAHGPSSTTVTASIPGSFPVSALAAGSTTVVAVSPQPQPVALMVPSSAATSTTDDAQNDSNGGRGGAGAVSVSLGASATVLEELTASMSKRMLRQPTTGEWSCVTPSIPADVKEEIDAYNTAQEVEERRERLAREASASQPAAIDADPQALTTSFGSNAAVTHSLPPGALSLPGAVPVLASTPQTATAQAAPSPPPAVASSAHQSSRPASPQPTAPTAAVPQAVAAGSQPQTAGGSQPQAPQGQQSQPQSQGQPSQGQGQASADEVPARPRRTESCAMPAARFGHTAVMTNEGTMVVFGGRNTGFLSDTWLFDLKQKTWRKIENDSGDAPTARAGHTATLTADGKSMIIIGGGVGFDENNMEVWSMDVSDFVSEETRHRRLAKARARAAAAARNDTARRRERTRVFFRDADDDDCEDECSDEEFARSDSAESHDSFEEALAAGEGFRQVSAHADEFVMDEGSAEGGSDSPTLSRHSSKRRKHQDPAATAASRLNESSTSSVSDGGERIVAPVCRWQRFDNVSVLNRAAGTGAASIALARARQTFAPPTPSALGLHATSTMQTAAQSDVKANGKPSFLRGFGAPASSFFNASAAPGAAACLAAAYAKPFAFDGTRDGMTLEAANTEEWNPNRAEPGQGHPSVTGTMGRPMLAAGAAAHQVPNATPFRRRGHTATVYKDEILVFGGGDDTFSDNELWSWHIPTATWHKKQTIGSKPECRMYHVTELGETADGNPGLIVFGGQKTPAPRPQHHTGSAGSPGPAQAPGIGAAGRAAAARGRGVGAPQGPPPMGLHGPPGRGAGPAQHAPAVAASANAVMARGRGAGPQQPMGRGGAAVGRAGGPGPQQARPAPRARAPPQQPCLNDLHILDLTTGVWTQVDATGEGPCPRMCSASLYRAGVFCVLLGGRAGNLCADAFELDVSTSHWRKVTAPCDVTRSRCTAVVHQNTVTLFGGHTGRQYSDSVHQLTLGNATLKKCCADWLRRHGASSAVAARELRIARQEAARQSIATITCRSPPASQLATGDLHHQAPSRSLTPQMTAAAVAAADVAVTASLGAEGANPVVLASMALPRHQHWRPSPAVREAQRRNGERRRLNFNAVEALADAMDDWDPQDLDGLPVWDHAATI